MKKADQELLDDIFLQPWFLSRETAFAIKRLLPREHRHRMRFYFDDYGCLKCGKRNLTYGSNGLCKICMQRVQLKLFLTVKRRWTAASPGNLPRTFTRMADAQRLLRDLLKRDRPSRKTLRSTGPSGSSG
jgi:hypothetical protein